MSAPTTEECRRIWTHRLHEDDIFYAKQNYFLIAESMLALAFATAYGAHARFVGDVISIAALLITVGWLYVNWRHNAIVQYVHGRAVDALPEFQKTYASWPKSPFRFGSMDVIAYGLPAVLCTMWVLLLVANAVA